MRPGSDVLEIEAAVDLTRVAREFDEMEKQSARAGRRAGQAFGEGAKEVGTFSRETTIAREGLTGLAMVVGSRVVGTFRGFLGLVGRTTASLVDLGAVGVLKVSSALDQMAERTRDANGELSAMGTAGKAAAGGLETVAKVALTVSGLITGAQIAVATLGASLIVAGHRAAAEFAPSWNRVRVSLGEAETGARDLRREVSDLAGELGVAGTEAADTFYEILGSMPQLLEDPARALEILRVALEAGSTGFTSSAEAAKALAAVLTAFSLEAEDARAVSDALFRAQGLGVTTVGEIGSSIGRVTGLASALNLEFNDLLGIVAALTPTGATTAEVITQIRAVLTNVVKPTAMARDAARELGIEFNAAALEAKGLNGFIVDLIQATGGRPEVLSRLFGSDEALALMVSLARETETLLDLTRQVGDASGDTAEAADRMRESWEGQKKLLDEKINTSLRNLGFEFESFGVTALEAINGVFSGWLKLERAMAGGPNAFGERLGERVRGAFGGPILRNDAAAGAADRWGKEGAVDALGRPYVPPSQRSSAAPAAEPATLEHATEKVNAYRTALQAAAVVEHARTGNAEAYAAAMRKAQEGVNRLVLAEADRLKAAGEETAAVNELLGMYEVVQPRQDNTRRQLLQEAAGLRDQLAGMMANLTATATDEASRALEKFEAELREKVAKSGQTLTDVEEATLARLKENIGHLGRLEGFDRELAIRVDAEATEESTRALADLVAQLRAYVDEHDEEGEALAESMALRQDYNRRIEQGERALARSRKTLQEEADETVRAEERRAEAAERAADERLRNLRDQARTLEENARGALQLAEAFGLIGTEAAGALQDVAQLATSVARLAGGDLSAIPSALGAIASLGSQFFGDSAAEKERKAIIERNTEALKALEASLGGFRMTGDVLAKAEERLGIMLDGVEGSERDAINYFLGQARGGKEWATDELAMFEALAKQFGIRLFNEDGKPIIQAWEQLRRAIALATEGLTGFGDGLDERRAAAELDADLYERSQEAVAKLQREFEHLADLAPEMVERFGLEGVDVSTAQGQAQLRAALQQMLEAFRTGALSLENLTREEFLSLLRSLGGALDDTAAAAERAGGGAVTGSAETRLNVNMTTTQGDTVISALWSLLYETQLQTAEARATNTLLAGGVYRVPVLTPPSPASMGVGARGPGVVHVHLGDLKLDMDLSGLVVQGGEAGAQRALEAGGRAFARGFSREVGSALRGQGLSGGGYQVRVDAPGVTR